jgi:tape measure domain-containing protein
MDLGALIAQLLLDASNWTSGINTALAGLDMLTSAAQAAGAAAAVGLSAAVVAGVESASSFQQAAMSMEVMLGSADAAKQMMTDIRDMAAVTPFDTQNLTKGAQQLMATGFAADKVLPILTALGDAAASMPDGMTAKLPRMIHAFGKINSAGKASLGAINQFVNAGIGAYQMLADKMGVSVAEVRAQITKGNVSSATALNAIMEGIQKKYGGMMEKQSKTLAGVWSTLTDSIKVPLADMANPLIEALSKAIPAISAILPGLLSGLKPIFDGLASVADAVGYLAIAFGQLSAPMQAVISYGVSGFMALSVALGVATGAAMLFAPSILGAFGAVVSGVGIVAATVVGLAGAFIPLLASMASFDLFAAAAAIDTALMNLSMLAAMVSAGTLGATMAALSAALVAAAGSALATAGSLFSAAVGALALDAAGGPLLIIMAALAATFAWLGIVVGTFAASMLSIATIITGTVIAAVVALYELWVNDFGGMQEIAGALWAVLGAGVSVIQGIGTAIAGAATEWLTSMGVIGDSTGTTFGSIKEAIVSGISSAVTSASGFIEDLRQSFLDMADSVILTLLKIAVAMGSLPGMEGAAAGGIAGLLQAQSGISQARGQTANIAGLSFKLPDLSGWVDEAKSSLADYGKILQSMFDGETTGGGKASSDAAKKAAQEAEDFQKIHDAAIEAEQALLNISAGMQAQAYQKGFDDMNAAAMATAATIDELDKMYVEALKAVKEFRKGLLDTVLSAGGDTGSIIKSAMDGFATGGIKGALAAATVQLLTLSPGFQKLSDGINKVLGDIMTAFDPLFNGLGMILIPAMQAVAMVFSSLAPIFQFIGNVLSGLGPVIVMVGVMMQVFGTIFQIFGNVLNAIGPIVEFAFQVVFTVMKGVAFVVLGIAYAIGSVWNGILNIIITVLEIVSKVTNKVDDAIAALEDMKVDTAGTAEAMQTLAGTTYESAYATAQASAQTAMMAEAAQEATESLSNVPSGFKVALSRFEAMAVESTAQSRAASSASSQRRGEGGITINIAAITAADPADLFDRLEKEANKRRYRKTGISIPTAPRFILGS